MAKPLNYLETQSKINRKLSELQKQDKITYSESVSLMLEIAKIINEVYSIAHKKGFKQGQESMQKAVDRQGTLGLE